MTDWAQISTGLLFNAYVEIHQVRRLVFDNYQQCPLSLSQKTKEGNFTSEIVLLTNVQVRQLLGKFINVWLFDKFVQNCWSVHVAIQEKQFQQFQTMKYMYV